MEEYGEEYDEEDFDEEEEEEHDQKLHETKDLPLQPQLDPETDIEQSVQLQENEVGRPIEIQIEQIDISESRESLKG